MPIIDVSFSQIAGRIAIVAYYSEGGRCASRAWFVLLLSLAPGMDISRPTACEATLAAWGF